MDRRGGFEKGHIPWNKGKFGKDNHWFGRKQRPEANIKRSLALKGRDNYWMRGKHRSEETKEKIRQARLKNNPGAIKPGEVRGIKPRGKNHPNWKGGISDMNDRGNIHNMMEYKIWRRAVLENDHYSCKYCGDKKSKLHAHHILSWAKYPEHRYNISNGLTLCVNCHKEVHKKK